MGNTDKPKRRIAHGKFLLGLLVVTFIVVAFLVYRNINLIITRALKENFEASIISEVYELKFENVRVNLAEGFIKVNDVSIRPKENPENEYPYINSTITLTTNEISLGKVKIFELIINKKLILEHIFISRPHVTLALNGKRNIFIPYVDATATDTESHGLAKLDIRSFALREFKLIDASVKRTNSFEKSNIQVEKFNISLTDLYIEELPAEYLFLINKVAVSLTGLEVSLQEGTVSYLSLDSYKMGIDSLSVKANIDTLTYAFSDFDQQLSDLDIQSEDSLFHITLEAFDLKYSDSSIKLNKLNISPNVSQATIQKKFKYQHLAFSGHVGSLEMKGIDFDAMIYQNKLLIDEIAIDSAHATIFKDKTKPIDLARKPPYIGQLVARIKTPVHIKKTIISRAHLNSSEKKKNGETAKIVITNGQVTLDNFTNLIPNSALLLNASAYIEGKAKAHLHIAYSYDRPEIKFHGSVAEFNLPDLNRLLMSHTPASVSTGVCDKITFSGAASETAATGSFEFLYHDLSIDLKLHEKAQWKSSVLSFAWNTILNTNNPPSSKVPSRKVQFHIERNMNKGFLNVLIRSVLDGLKKTMVMDKENKAAYKEEKKQSKKDAKSSAKEQK